MIDYNTLYFILFFIFWIYLLDLTIEKKDMVALKYLQFVLMFPLIIFLGSNSYIQGLIFGYVICLVIGIVSLYVMIKEYIT